MPKLITLEDGSTQEVFTAEDLAAERKKVETDFKGKLDEKDKYVNDKLDQFMKARQGDEAKQKEVDEKLAEAKRIADETAEKLSNDQKSRLTIYEDFVIEQYVGADPELKKKIVEAGAIIGIPKDNEANVKASVAAAMKQAGLDNTRSHAPITGGFAPQSTPQDDVKKSEEFEKFTNVLGLTNLIKKPEAK